MIDFLSLTNTAPLIEAISNGRTVFIYKLSKLDPSYLDIHAILPTIDEAYKIKTLLIEKPDWEWDIETTVVSKYCLIDLEKTWLQTDAPAGFVSSIVISLLNFAFPDDVESLNAILDIGRNQQTVFGQIKEKLIAADISPKDVEKLDVYKFLELAALSEFKLGLKGVQENGFSFIVPGKEKKPYRPGMAQPIAPASSNDRIDMDRQNADLEALGVLIDEEY